MPITLGGLATGTKILSGLAGIFGGKKSNNLVDSQHAMVGRIRGAHQGAKEAGIHTLAALGLGGGHYSSAQPTGVASGIGQVSDALQERADQKKAAPITAKQGELMDAQIAESRSRTLLNAANSRRAIYGPDNNPTGITGGLEGMDPGELGTDRGSRREPTPDMPARQKVSLGKYTAKGPNPEAFEVGMSELIAGAMIYGPQWAVQYMRDQLKRARDYKPSPPAGKKSTKTRTKRKNPWDHDKWRRP